MTPIKLCTYCKYSNPEKNSNWNLRCTNQFVNAKDSWALSQQVFEGSSCREEREKKWFAACGMSGKQWESK